MRLHALIFALFVLRAQTASLPDKTDIQKKLTHVVKEVLEKDQVPPQNEPSEPEINQNSAIDEIENNLRKSADAANIPVKVVIDNVKPELRTEPENNENNEVVPVSEESAEIKRVEIDLKNPGPPQRMEHDTQNPVYFRDPQLVVLQNSQTLNSWWHETPQYNLLQNDLKTLKDNFNKKIDELNESIQNMWSDEPEVEEVSVNLRASIKQDAPVTPAPSPGFGNPFQGGGPFAQMIQNWQTSLTNFNQTVNEYFSNQTTQFSGNNNTNVNGGTNWFNFGNFNGGQPEGAQSDESRPPGIWQNIQNFFGGGNNQKPPASAQADSPQPAQPYRPVLQAIQTAFQNGVNIFQPNNNNNKPAEVPQQPAPVKPAEEGSNEVPAVVKPEVEKEKQKPETPQPVTQSGPIKQMIGNNPIIQGIAGAVQRIQHTINPEKPREEEVKSVEPEDPATKGHKPSGSNTGDIHDDSPRVEVKNEPVEVTQAEPQKEVDKQGRLCPYC